MIHWFWVLVIAFLAVCLGWFLCAAFTVAKRADEHHERLERLGYIGEDPWWHQN